MTVRIYATAGKLQRVITDKDHRPGYYNQVWGEKGAHSTLKRNGANGHLAEHRSPEA